MRKIGIPEIEDIALGAALLGAGGGGDPYIGKLVAVGAVQEHGPVTLIEPEEVPDDALVVPIAMMGAPTVLAEKAVGRDEYQTLYDTVSTFYGKPIYAFMPIEAGGVNSMLPIAAAGQARPAFWWIATAWPCLPRTADGHVHHRRRLGPPPWRWWMKRAIPPFSAPSPTSGPRISPAR